MTWVVVWKDAYGRRHRDKFEKFETAVQYFWSLANSGEDVILTTEGNENA